jgi:hypothetical protein
VQLFEKWLFFGQRRPTSGELHGKSALETGRANRRKSNSDTAASEKIASYARANII